MEDARSATVPSVPEFVIPPKVVRVWDTETEDKIVSSRLAGTTIRAIAEEHGKTVEQVQRVLHLRGITYAKVLAKRDSVEERRRRALAKRITAVLEREGPMTTRQLADELGAGLGEVRAAIRDDDKPRLHRRPRRLTKWAADELLVGLRAVAATRKGHISMAYYDGHRDLETTPPGSRVARSLGSWPAACRAAGIPDRPVPAPVRWTDDDVAWWVAVFLQRVRRGLLICRATDTDYAAWAREDVRVPVLTVVLARFGTWDAAVQAARAQQMT